MTSSSNVSILNSSAGSLPEALQPSEHTTCGLAAASALLKSAPTNREGQQLTTGKFMALHPEPSQFGVKSEKCVTSLRVFGKFLGSK
jgi:hypothetical protein